MFVIILIAYLLLNHDVPPRLAVRAIAHASGGMTKGSLKTGVCFPRKITNAPYVTDVDKNNEKIW
jgi:hypothetical protein